MDVRSPLPSLNDVRSTRGTTRSNGIDDALVRIERVGSTAVPILAAKDVVDADAVVEEGAVDRVSRTLVSELGGTRVENARRWHHVFGRHDGRRFDDHLFAASDDGWTIAPPPVPKPPGTRHQ